MLYWGASVLVPLISSVFFCFCLVLGFHWVMAYCLPVWQEGLIFARHTRAHEHNLRPELMTLKMLKYSNRQTGFPFPIQANRLAIIVFTVSNSLSLNLESLVPTWVNRAQRCLSSKNHRVCISISDGFPISMALAKPDAPAKPALRLMAMLTNSRDH